MYTILMQNDKSLIATRKETIFEKETNVDTLRFLVPTTYGDLDLRKFSVLMKYTTNVDRKERYELLEAQPELYRGYMDLRLGVNTNMTALPGDIDIRLTFNDTAKAEGSGLFQEVLHTDTITITVEPIKNLYGFNSCESLELIDKIMGSIDAKIEATNILANSINQNKASDIELINDELWLVNNDGGLMGDPVNKEELSGSASDNKWEEF